MDQRILSFTFLWLDRNNALRSILFLLGDFSLVRVAHRQRHNAFCFFQQTRSLRAETGNGHNASAEPAASTGSPGRLLRNRQDAINLTFIENRWNALRNYSWAIGETTNVQFVIRINKLTVQRALQLLSRLYFYWSDTVHRRITVFYFL